MNLKAERQRKVLGLMHGREVATQGELKKLLHAAGVDVDQATLSRDIKELGLVKVPTEKGYKYALVDEASPVIPARSAAMVSRFVKDIDHSGQLVVLKTDPGNAPAVAEALDHLAWSGVIGTLAGDNTVFVACRETSSARKVASRIGNLKRGIA